MKFLILMVYILAYAAVSGAADVDSGEALHMEHCSACHTASIYTREKRVVADINKLGTQVRFCKDNLGIMWFEEDVGDVVQYLNEQYYHF
ncbi:MAG: cytochrome c [Gammaproteobacteria bacterium]|nr:cytochrome c [Gammaproteobacteria bacterium]